MGDDSKQARCDALREVIELLGGMEAEESMPQPEAGPAPEPAAALVEDKELLRALTASGE